MLNYEESRESRNTRLTHEISECKDKILERERERDKNLKHSNLSWNCFLGMGAFAAFLGFIAYHNDGR